MGNPRQNDDKWVESAKNGDYKNLLMLRFEDVIGMFLDRNIGFYL